MQMTDALLKQPKAAAEFTGWPISTTPINLVLNKD